MHVNLVDAKANIPLGIVTVILANASAKRNTQEGIVTGATLVITISHVVFHVIATKMEPGVIFVNFLGMDDVHANMDLVANTVDSALQVISTTHSVSVVAVTVLGHKIMNVILGVAGVTAKRLLLVLLVNSVLLATFLFPLVTCVIVMLLAVPRKFVTTAMEGVFANQILLDSDVTSASQDSINTPTVTNAAVHLMVHPTQTVVTMDNVSAGVTLRDLVVTGVLQVIFVSRIAYVATAHLLVPLHKPVTKELVSASVKLTLLA